MSAKALRFGSKVRPKLKEAPILQHVLQYLRAEAIWRMRVHCGRARVGGNWKKSEWGAGWTERKGEQWIWLADKGTPDVMLIIPVGRRVVNPWTLEPEIVEVARPAFIETKAEARGYLTTEQKQFFAWAEREGVLCWKVSDLEELRKFIPPRIGSLL